MQKLSLLGRVQQYITAVNVSSDDDKKTHSSPYNVSDVFCRPETILASRLAWSHIRLEHFRSLSAFDHRWSRGRREMSPMSARVRNKLSETDPNKNTGQLQHDLSVKGEKSLGWFRFKLEQNSYLTPKLLIRFSWSSTVWEVLLQVLCLRLISDIRAPVCCLVVLHPAVPNIWCFMRR